MPWLAAATAVAIAGSGAAALLSHQGAGPAAAAGSSASPSASKPPAPAIRISPAAGSAGVRLDAPVVVTSSGGRLTTVRVVTAGKIVPGSLDTAGTSWRSSNPLAAARAYAVSAMAAGAGGRTAAHSTFRTLTPRKVLTADVFPWGNRRVGVGSPIVVRFSSPVAHRAAVEKRLVVAASKPVTGAWRWFSSTEAHYRPRAYWPAYDRVRLHVDLAGLDAGKGTWGTRTREVSFRIGAAHTSVVDARRHVMTVSSQGMVVRTVKVSVGRDRYPTHAGVHVVLEKMPVRTMDSRTVGIPRNSPDGYFETVYWDTRISNSGEFVHAAPWSARAQGRTNVSHGCVNVSTADAEWFYGFSQVGDVVSVVHTGEPSRLDDAGTADWNVSWRTWLQGSALGAGRPTAKL